MQKGPPECRDTRRRLWQRLAHGLLRRSDADQIADLRPVAVGDSDAASTPGVASGASGLAAEDGDEPGTAPQQKSEPSSGPRLSRSQLCSVRSAVPRPRRYRFRSQGPPGVTMGMLGRAAAARAVGTTPACGNRLFDEAVCPRSPSGWESSFPRAQATSAHFRAAVKTQHGRPRQKPQRRQSTGKKRSVKRSIRPSQDDAPASERRLFKTTEVADPPTTKG